MAAGDQRFTRLGTEVIGRSPRAGQNQTVWTRLASEVVGKPKAAPWTQLTRFVVEVVGRSPRAGQYQTVFTRLSSEAIGKARTAPLTKFTRLVAEVVGRSPRAGQNQTVWTRLVGEALGKARPVPQTRFTRLAVELIGLAPPPPGPRAQFTRLAVEVLGENQPRTYFTRLAVEVIFDLLGAIRMTPQPIPAVLANIFAHNWAAAAKLESAYSTDVTQAAASLAEERKNLIDRPYRTLFVRFLGFDKGETLRLYMTAARLCAQNYTPIPLFTDASRVTSSSSGTTINCDTRYRRFFLNELVLIHAWDSKSRPTNVEIGKVVGLTDSTITLESALANTFPAGSRVYPCIQAKIALGVDGSMVTDEVTDMALTITEQEGQSALPSTLSSYTNPPGFPTYNSKPIFDVGLDWKANLKSKVFRGGEKSASGRGELIFPAGDRPQFEHELKMTLLGRDRFWKVLQFFDSRLGRCRSFYMVDPASKFEPTALLTTQLQVKPRGNIADLQAFMSHVAIVLRDGTIYIRGVSSVTVSGPDWVIAFDSPIPSTSLANVRKATQAYLVRLKDDVMAEEWLTDECCSITLPAVEVLHEADQDISNVPYVPTGPAPLQVPDLYLWCEPNRNTFSDGTRATRVGPGAEPGDYGTAVGVWDDVRTVSGPTYLLGAAPPAQITEADAEINAGRPMLKWLTTGKFKLRPLGDDFFDNTAGKGLTVFFAYRPGDIVGTWNYFLKKTGVLEIGPTQAKLFETLDTVDATLYVNYSNMLSGDLSRNVVGLFTWKPSTYAKMYKNGVLMGSAASQVTSLPSEATRECDFYDMATQFGGNDIIVFKRALTSAELNKVGGFLAEMYHSSWSTIP